jgi:hypothetical protein
MAPFCKQIGVIGKYARVAVTSKFVNEKEG